MPPIELNSPASVRIAVVADTPAEAEIAAGLAHKLGFVVVTANNAKGYDFILSIAANGLSLVSQRQEPPGSLFIDYLTGSLGFRFKKNEGKNQPLAKAVGVKPNKTLRVFDVTGGTGRDSIVLAQQGCNVTLCERSPILFALLEDAFIRASNNEAMADICRRIQVKNVDAIAFLNALSPDDYPDVIYLDPMYPHRTKSAAVKKEMRFLRALVGDDTDASELLRLALTRARQRVVVKRPKGAENLGGAKPTHVIESPNTRFDVYMVG